MNIVTLASMRVKAGTTAELVQAIRDSARRQKYPGLVEVGLYLLPDKADQILALAVWDSLNSLTDFTENYKPAINQEVVARSQVVNRQTYRMVKEYRTVSSRVGASHLLLMTFYTAEPEERLKHVIETIAQIRAAGQEAGHVGVWLGRLMIEPATDQLNLLVRHDWRSLEEQRAFMGHNLTLQIRGYTKAKDLEVEYASLDLAGLVRLESSNTKESG